MRLRRIPLCAFLSVLAEPAAAAARRSSWVAAFLTPFPRAARTAMSKSYGLFVRGRLPLRGNSERIQQRRCNERCEHQKMQSHF